MLGDKINELTGKIIGTRSPWRGRRYQGWRVSFAVQGKLLGIDTVEVGHL